jgi:hypothetical protein
MQKKFLALCAVAALFATPGITLAQAVGNGGATYSDVTNKNAWADFTPRFVTATLNAMAAQSSMLTTLGMPEPAATLTAQAKDLSRDTPPGMVESIMAARSKAAQGLTTRLGTAGLTIDPARHAQFGADIDAMALALKEYREIGTDLPYTKTQLRGAGAKGRTGLFIAKSLPDYMRDLKAELAAAVAVAKAGNIAYAPEVNTILAQ